MIRLRFLACPMLVLWVALVFASFLAGFRLDDTRPLVRAYGAARPWLLTLPAWLALPLGRPIKLTGACLLAAMTLLTWEPAPSIIFQPLVLLGLILVTASAQRFAGPSHWELRNDHDR
ncbi:MAG: hypothetical protein IT318_21775 [Anaerolineales bacterium]|nr:hypothetical protein [Anaerolineales bacterium]